MEVYQLCEFNGFFLFEHIINKNKIVLIIIYNITLNLLEKYLMYIEVH